LLANEASFAGKLAPAGDDHTGVVNFRTAIYGKQSR
jgi:hypothetical protein